MSVPTAEPIESPALARRSDRLAAWVLGWPLAAVLAILCLVELATWVPHYLTWPWFPDHDVFATAALGWDRGMLPYRDLRGNNFPGTIYLFWALGKLFGWGRTAPFFAVDAALVATFGVVLVAWGRRRLGRALPALIGYGVFLGYYLALDYSQVAQRDWHGPCFALSGILILQGWPGRFGRLIAAAAMATALVVRPQVVLFAPAFVLAIDEGTNPGRGRTWKTIGASFEWGVATAGILALEFLPLVRAGIWADFLEALRLVAPGGGYNILTGGSFAKQMMLQVKPLRVLIVPACIAMLLGPADPGSRRLARTWLATLGLALLYGPLSPHIHAYLIHPLSVTWCVAVAVLAHLVLREPSLTPTLRLIVVLLIVGLGITARPRFCNPRGSLEAIEFLRAGTMPGPCPTGYTSNPEVPAAADYPWADYRNLIIYLKIHVGPDTKIANALKSVPAVTGPVGRLPAFPAESVAWTLIVHRDDEDAFAESLRSTPDSVAVWSPAELDDPGMPRLQAIVDVIRELYEPRARFGRMEVWRRKPALPRSE